MSKKSKSDGNQKFIDFYSSMYGSRWDSLASSMKAETNTQSLSDRLVKPYYMDSASVLAVSQLPVQSGQTVLDMCAAPGGKTLYLALKLNGKGRLISNDRSAARRNRLISVLDSCLDSEMRKTVKVTGYDSTKWGLYEKDVYDSVLLDAPCSSERHVINDMSALSQWGTNRPKMLANTQFAMLAAALEAVKPDGFILYSTCSINSMENQDNIAKLLNRRDGRVCVVPVCGGEELEYGNIVLPDTGNGHGPLYFCLLRKIC